MTQQSPKSEITGGKQAKIDQNQSEWDKIDENRQFMNNWPCIMIGITSNWCLPVKESFLGHGWLNRAQNLRKMAENGLK